MKFKNPLIAAFLMLSSFATNAALITDIELIDSNNFSITMSGTIEGPLPSGDTWLFILLNPSADPTTCGTSLCTANYVSGDLQEGDGFAPSYTWVADYLGGPHIQFNWGGHINVGDVMSGSSIYSVSTGHGMTSSDFVDAAVYWGFGASITNGTYQGAVNISLDDDSEPVPATGSFALLVLGLAGIALRKKKIQVQ